MRHVAHRYGQSPIAVWRAPASAVSLAFAGVLEDEYAEQVRDRQHRLDLAYLVSAIHTAKPMDILGKEQQELTALLWDYGRPEDAAKRAKAAGLLP